MIKLYVNMVLCGTITLDKVPSKYRAAVEEYLNKLSTQAED